MNKASINDRINIALLACGIIVEDDNNSSDGTDDKDSTRFIQDKKVDRYPMLVAMRNKGHSVSSLAKATGVDPSQISRLLREPVNNDPDESARNPSINLAAAISRELSSSSESLFPDIFNTNRPDLKPKHYKNK